MAAELDRPGRRWFAPIGLGAALCVACCLAPILIAAGVIGGGALLVGLSWLEPLGFALIGLGIVGLLWSRARARRIGCDSGSSDRDAGCSNTGCGCADTATLRA
ncbi:hypothetical protein [Nocardia bovistercoris]|uniref:Mercuric ion transport protein n=1 Tax=Nocardia bovistercoris TaxID=2785916 RepID=A0A931IJ46_9NOCA|nr:hypothetical protein [Nocardia bovistercoris]MBH0780625.1 hypothetical protein [Nocardia bovistercoris]